MAMYCIEQALGAGLAHFLADASGWALIAAACGFVLMPACALLVAYFTDKENAARASRAQKEK